MKQLIKSLDQLGSLGALIAAIAAPCCFPLFAAVGTAVGLGLSRNMKISSSTFSKALQLSQ